MIFEEQGNHITMKKTDGDAQQLEAANAELQRKRNDELERKMEALMKQLGITEL